MLTLTIDGNYFAQRLRTAIDLTFIDDPEADKKILFTEAAKSMAAEIRSLGGLISHVVVARDWSSWRKDITPVYPIESQKEDGTKEVYKANRGGDKSYDVGAFYAAYDEFCDRCEKTLGIPVIKAPKAEADDGVYIVSLILGKMGQQCLAWSSDGDYIQLVSDSCHLMKFPQRKLCILKGGKATAVNPIKTLDDVFGGKAPDRFKAVLESYDKNLVARVNPMKSLFFKIVHGDPKDNVPELFMWLSSTGKRKYRPSDKQITKAWLQLGYDYTDITEDMIYNKKLIFEFITALLQVTKQTRDLDHCWKVYTASLKLKHLSIKQIPKEISQSLVRAWNDKKHIKADISKCTNYQKILEAINEVEAGSYFAGFDLTEKT